MEVQYHSLNTFSSREPWPENRCLQSGSGVPCRNRCTDLSEGEILMRIKLLLITFAIMASLTASRPVFAHHGAASFDNSRTVTIDGTVTDFLWTNPHVYLKIDAKDESGTIQHWVIEAQS